MWAIVYNGEAIDPGGAEDASTTYPLPEIQLGEDQTIQAQLEIVEWTRPSSIEPIFFCDPSGVARGKIRARIHAPGFNFTAYLRSEEVPRLEKEGAILLDELHPDVKALAEAARGAMREHFGAPAGRAGQREDRELEGVRIVSLQGGAGQSC